MWMFTNLRFVMMTVIAVTQVDVAIISVLCSELTSIYTIRLLLNKKEFENGYAFQNTMESDETYFNQFLVKNFKI